MPAQSCKIILFDLDGTLLETSAEIADALNDTLADLALAPVEQSRVDAWIGHGTRALLVQALALRWGVSDAEVLQSSRLPQAEVAFSAHYLRRCGTRSRPYPCVPEVLQALRLSGVKLAIVTNKESRYVQRLLDAHGMSSWFDRVVCGDTFEFKKPNPQGVTACLVEFGVAPEQALFVGDSSIDIATARRAGVPVWAVPYGYNLGQPIEASAPDRVIADVSALMPQSSSTRFGG